MSELLAFLKGLEVKVIEVISGTTDVETGYRQGIKGVFDRVYDNTGVIEAILVPPLPEPEIQPADAENKEEVTKIEDDLKKQPEAADQPATGVGQGPEEALAQHE
jgi:hypothetical protein